MNTSRTISSNQAGCHPRLGFVVRKHLDSKWRRPPSRFAADVFNTVQDWLAAGDAPLILDSGCGAAESSIGLALRYPDCRVLGFDRSAARLNRRRDALPNNCMVIRADAMDIWRQLVEAGVHTKRHFLLYPNPYPKASQLNSRWHGSPAFPFILYLGGFIEVRSNWKTYLDEFQQALTVAGICSRIELNKPETALTLFERKYSESGHDLWRLTADLDIQRVSP